MSDRGADRAAEIADRARARREAVRAMRGRELGARKMDGAPGMGAGGRILVPTKFHGSSRGSAGVKFLVWAPIFSYGGSCSM